MLRALTLSLMLLAGCRLETAPPDPAGAGTSDSAGASLRAAGPPVVAGDTARVTPDEAAVAPPAAEGTVTAPTGLVVPVVGVAPADLVDTFAQARSEGRRHDAIDILAPRGTPVVAAAPGEVLRLFTSDKGGLTVYQLDADGRTVYYYAHLDATAPGLAAGQRLRAGDAIGTVGDSGNAVPGNTHLHFAIWRIADRADFWDGTPLNPYALLTGGGPERR